MAEDNKRPKPKLTWSQSMTVKRFHPYSYQVNKLLRSFGRMLGTINPDMIDTDLARLYMLSHGHEENFLSDTDAVICDLYNKVYYEKIGDIQHWLYSSIASWIESYKKLFDLDKVYSTDAHVHDISNSEVCETHSDTNLPIMLGYTSQLNVDILQELNEIVMSIQNKQCDLDDNDICKKIYFKLMNINMMMKRNKQRARAQSAILNNVDRCSADKKHNLFVRDSVQVSSFSEPLCSLLPDAVSIDKQYKNNRNYIDHCEQTYCREKLMVYGMVLQILSRLRDPYDEDKYDFNNDNRHYDEYNSRWISTLPSYRPEFIVTLDNFSDFKFKKYQDTDASRNKESLKYLKQALIFKSVI